MFRFVSSEEVLTPELEAQVTAASAWARVVPTGAAKPENSAGALVLQSFADINSRISMLEQRLAEEVKARTEGDLVIANHVARTNNLLREKRILERDVERLDHAHTLLYQCQVCIDRQRTIRLSPCGHMATCEECTQRIMNDNGLCPLCRVAVTRAERTFIS